MKAIDLYQHLEQDFKLSSCKDDWQFEDYEYITENFKARSMGLVADNSDIINKVYTAVFPSDSVIRKIASEKKENALLFLHHPMQWDMNKPIVFQEIPKSSMQLLKDLKVSIYNLHVPMDRNSDYSTSVNLAKKLDISILDEFYEYYGVLIGVIGETECQSIHDLQAKFEKEVGHRIQLYNYGSEIIADNTIGVVAGGGNEEEIYEFLAAKGINTFVTGIANERKDYIPSVLAHEAARKNKINVLAGTHYSTEKFACMKMVEYFESLGLPCEFIPDEPCMEDM